MEKGSVNQRNLLNEINHFSVDSDFVPACYPDAEKCVPVQLASPDERCQRSEDDATPLLLKQTGFDSNATFKIRCHIMFMHAISPVYCIFLVTCMDSSNQP